MNRIILLIERNPLWQQGRVWYEHRPPKDRRTLQVLAMTLLAALVYLMVWEPVTGWSDQQQQNYQYQEEINTWLQSNLGKARELQKKQQSASLQRELSSIISGTANQSNILLSRVQPDRKGVSVWIEDTAYQKMLKWFLTLETKYNVRVHQVRIDRLKEEGRVKAYIHLGG